MVRAFFQPDVFEKLTASNPKLVFTLASYALILMIYVNLNSVKSAGLGIALSIPYFWINGIFLGYAFFSNEGRFLRFVLGILLLVMFLGFVGWVVMVIRNLDVPGFILVLLVVSTISSLANKRMRTNNAT
jgi:hypothetical protein